MPIVDLHGNPITMQELREPQTARTSWLRREFANHPSRGLTPAKLARILEDAERGDLIAQAELGMDMEEKDAHIFAELHKRKMALVGLDWEIRPPKDASAREKKSASALKEWIEDAFDFADIVFDAADAIGHGFSAQEITWRPEGSGWLPEKIEHRPQTWFMLDPDDRNLLRLRDQSPAGAELWPFGWILHVHRSRSGYIGRAGLHRVLAWPFLFKNYSVRDLAEFLEIYGLPLRIGKYPVGSSEEEKRTLLQAVVNIGHNAAGIIPEGMMIEILEAAKGASDPFQAMMNWCERSQSKAILGGTLTAEPGEVGSRSLGEVHNEVRIDIRNSDARQIAKTLTEQLVYPLGVLNGLISDPRRTHRLVFDTQEAEDLGLYADALPKLISIGMRIPERYAHDKLRIPEPEGDEPVLGAAIGPSASDQPSAAARASLGIAADDPLHPAEMIADRMEIEAAPALRDWLERIRSLVDRAQSLTELRDLLLSAYGDLPTEDLARLMQAGFAVADLSGRFDVAETHGRQRS
ncbi:MAG TPA: DUF935 domain-containing protein [Methylococcus sp.]|nr:DUF935 domain-containing protein [Methylococcus sp.]